MENRMEVSPKQLKIEPAYDSAVLPLDIYLKNTKKKKNSKRCMHLYVHCISIYSREDMETNCPLMGEWIKKMWYMYTMAYYSTIKRYLAMCMTTWMDLKGLMLSEIKSEKDKYHMISL